MRFPRRQPVLGANGFTTYPRSRSPSASCKHRIDALRGWDKGWGQRRQTRISPLPFHTNVRLSHLTDMTSPSRLGFVKPIKAISDLTIPQAARKLGISRQRVHQLVTTGKLKAHRVDVWGRIVYLIPRAAVNRRLRQFLKSL